MHSRLSHSHRAFRHASAMNLLLLGSTGRTGQLVLERAVCRGHDVTAVVRKQGTYQSRERLRIVVGDPLRADALKPALPGRDVVISCLGQRSRNDAHRLRDAAAATPAAITHTGVRRYLVVSQGLLFDGRNPVLAVLRLFLKRYLDDSAAMEHLVRASEVDWTIVRPPRLKEGSRPR